MPDRLSMIETSFPEFHAGESTAEKVTDIQEYLFKLKEELSYTLRNLDADNINPAAFDELAKRLQVKSTPAQAVDDSEPLRITALDFSDWSNGTFTETLEGGFTNTYTVTFDASDRPVLITDQAGNEMAVTW